MVRGDRISSWRNRGSGKGWCRMTKNKKLKQAKTWQKKKTIAQKMKDGLVVKGGLNRKKNLRFHPWFPSKLCCRLLCDIMKATYLILPIF